MCVQVRVNCMVCVCSTCVLRACVSVLVHGVCLGQGSGWVAGVRGCSKGPQARLPPSARAALAGARRLPQDTGRPANCKPRRKTKLTLIGEQHSPQASSPGSVCACRSCVREHKWPAEVTPTPGHQDICITAQHEWEQCLRATKQRRTGLERRERKSRKIPLLTPTCSRQIWKGGNSRWE